MNSRFNFCFSENVFLWPSFFTDSFVEHNTPNQSQFYFNMTKIPLYSGFLCCSWDICYQFVFLSWVICLFFLSGSFQAFIWFAIWPLCVLLWIYFFSYFTQIQFCRFLGHDLCILIFHILSLLSISTSGTSPRYVFQKSSFPFPSLLTLISYFLSLTLCVTF